MIVVQLAGGLGNQLFQYAAGRSLAYRLNTELKLDISKFKRPSDRKYALSPFNIIENFVSGKELMLIKKSSHSLKNFIVTTCCKIIGKDPLTPVKESGFTDLENFFSLPDNVYLEGYWQSEKYFSEIREIIRDDFRIITEQDPVSNKMSDLIQKSDSVSIHIRRGDYVSDPKTNYDHGLCPQKYYDIAIEKIEACIEDPVFFIFSDDPSWVQKEFKIFHNHILVNINKPDKNFEDLRLMTLCKNHIIANSSFSWWGAWLSENPDKIVYAPKKWFNNPAYNSKNLIPDGWTRI
jgi:hypothetical protein